jgi:predicted esterase
MDPERVEKRSFLLPLKCNYLLRKPEQASERALLVIALHGHAMTPEQMLRLVTPLVGEEHTIASLQGPYQLWVNEDQQTRSRVAFHWATNFEAVHSRRLHHEMIRRVIEEAGAPAGRIVLVGFSQSVSLNYRFVCTHTEAVRGAIGICGGVPGDWEEGPYQPTRTAALHIATREDEYYAPAVTEAYPERLRKRIADVEFHLLDGGHRIPSSARPIVQGWLERLRRESGSA